MRDPYGTGQVRRAWLLRTTWQSLFVRKHFMSARKTLVAVALLTVAATARAGWSDALPEPAMVTLLFIALAVIAFAIRPKAKAPVDA